MTKPRKNEWLKRECWDIGMGLRPQGRFGPGFEGNRGWCDGQPGSMGMVEWEEPDGASHAVLLGGLGPAQGCQGPPASKLARPAAGPLPAPLLRRLASAPPVGPG